MTIFELDITWVSTSDLRRRLHWELLATDEVRGVFLTSREDTLAVLFDGSRDESAAWSHALTSGLATSNLPFTSTRPDGETR
jgi:hypothetical protein